MSQAVLPLPVLFEDDELIAIDKPSGLLVHRSWIAKEATEFALQRVRDQIGQRVYPVHRLDRPTSGILLFAKSAASARVMTEIFSQRQIQKGYHAVVRGYLGDGILDYPLKEELDKIADAQADPNKAAQAAVTAYRCLRQVELPFAVSKRHSTTRYSLMHLLPQTGRKHQLRRHMSHLRHPIIGDSNHGDGRHNRFFREQFGLSRLMLAATSLQFPHPITEQPVVIELAVPKEFELIFNQPPAIAR
ncbi:MULTISPECIES: tRNA pseudouridine(65) synthase TruC [Idiomarina]|uniref:tRNA pseudouridine(65) synthase TruC n=1 Tax=Idiomarina TaxID=135575 RepID=UPI00129BA648|nr:MULTISPECIES: tRNA pseudouridine(65) synthase TruC [Idiomarina]MRJ41476.1 tRNA pseudouridine(65) synthase TruC [Idiomarina sp. FeN1]NCU56951.1 tRNA pseudouridine(65) synthase TruC [Idiomarina sp. FenA--70]NCU59660.1 tRNA pseudouridine(65) synthase TruC [Idiomarina sp. FenBw--71]UUN14309.1 tRNA pseudouridine(65) synthase TruC [Idiomarina loihiensis]